MCVCVCVCVCVRVCGVGGWVSVGVWLGTDQRMCGYRSEDIDDHGYRSEKAWVQIREHILFVWIRERLGTVQRVGTDQGLGTD